MKTAILTSLLIAGTITLHAAETDPLAAAKYRWNMSADSAALFDIRGNVKLGVSEAGAEAAARFDGGFSCGGFA